VLQTAGYLPIDARAWGTESDATTHLVLERVHGASFSHLLLENVLAERDLVALLNVLAQFHASDHPDGPVLPDGSSIYDNYLPKITSRRKANLAVPGTESSYNVIVEWAHSYQKVNSGQTAVIHGDPVFTNTFLTPLGTILLVDPRGHLNSGSSLLVDANYEDISFLKLAMSRSRRPDESPR
jgi:hypothetical protein